MTHEASYTFRNPGTNPVTGLTLYEASKALKEAAESGNLHDATRVTRGARFVAFWCAHDNVVKSGFGATEAEKYVTKCWGVSVTIAPAN